MYVCMHTRTRVCVSSYILTPPAQNTARKKQKQRICHTKKYMNMYNTVVVGFSLVSKMLLFGCNAEWLSIFITMFRRTAG
jgi:hypothetical protein